MISAGFERRLVERASRVASRAVDGAVAARVSRLSEAPLPGVADVEGRGTSGDGAVVLTGVRLRQRYVSDADLRRLIRERLA